MGVDFITLLIPIWLFLVGASIDSNEFRYVVGRSYKVPFIWFGSTLFWHGHVLTPFCCGSSRKEMKGKGKHASDHDTGQFVRPWNMALARKSQSPQQKSFSIFNLIFNQSKFMARLLRNFHHHHFQCITFSGPCLVPRAPRSHHWWREACLDSLKDFYLDDSPTGLQVSNEKNPGWLGYIGDYTPSYIGIIINHYKDP